MNGHTICVAVFILCQTWH